jgi:hypothetical protein
MFKLTHYQETVMLQSINHKGSSYTSLKSRSLSLDRV